jgi:RHS repeat-associated protein
MQKLALRWAAPAREGCRLTPIGSVPEAVRTSLKQLLSIDGWKIGAAHAKWCRPAWRPALTHRARISEGETHGEARSVRDLSPARSAARVASRTHAGRVSTGRRAPARAAKASTRSSPLRTSTGEHQHYDPETSLFLQLDPYVQAPFFSQSLNRFAYVFNNPLKLVDPSGFQGTEKNEGGGATTGGNAAGNSSVSPNYAVWADTKEGFHGEPGQVVGVDGTPYAAVESGTGAGWLAFERSGSPDADEVIGAAVGPWGSTGNRGTSQSPGLNPGSSTADSPGQSSGAPAGGPGGPGATGATSGASTGSLAGVSGSGGGGDARSGKVATDASSKAWQDALIAAAFFGGEPSSSIGTDGTGSEFGAPGGRCEDCEGGRWWQVGYLLGTVAKVGPRGTGVGRLTRGGGAAGAGAGQTFEIVDGLRRAKAAELAGKTTVAAEVRVGGRVVGTMDIPLDSLRSPFKSAIDVSSHPSQMSRFKSILDATRAGDSLPPISVQPGGRGSSISDIVFK